MGISAKKFRHYPGGEGGDDTLYSAHKNTRVLKPRILLQSQPRQFVQYMGEFVLSDIVRTIIKRN